MKRGLDVNVVRDMVARIFVGSLFVLLAINLFGDFMKTGHVTGLLFLVSESLVVVLTIVRRRAQQIDRSVTAALLTTLSVIGPSLVRVTNSQAVAPDLLTAIVSIVGVIIVIAGKLTIGRSFGLVPANRGVVDRGPYNVVRHPIYAGYMLTHAATLAAYPTVWNVTIMLAADTALVLRALVEERVLIQDASYQAYCRRVGWHLVPGVF